MQNQFIDNIDEIYEQASIKLVVEHYVKLDSKGFAACPVHNGKDKNFSIKESYNLCRCFSQCSKSWNAVQLVQEIDNCDWYEAVIKVASICGIDVSYKELNDAEQSNYNNKLAYRKVLQSAVNKFKEGDVSEFISKRNYTDLTALKFNIGLANKSNTITELVKDKPDVLQKCKDLGLIRNGKFGNYDLFKSRITFPIHDRYGNLCGFGGRDVSGKAKAKYINSTESLVFKKRELLYGLHLAINKIREIGYAILVEGYTDVISLHQAGLGNAVAACGTSFTIEQAKVLKKYTNKVLIIKDGDAAGLKSTLRDIDILVKAGFITAVFELPKNNDPDEWIQQNIERVPEFNSFDNFNEGFAYKVNKLFKSDDSLAIKQAAINELHKTISLATDAIIRKEFSTTLEKLTGHKPENNSINKPTGNNLKLTEDDVDYDMFFEHGFFILTEPERIGIYRPKFGKDRKFERVIKITNFIIKPFYHIYSKEDNKRLIELDNGYDKAVIELESRALASMAKFVEYCISEGNFQWFEEFKPTFLKIRNYLQGASPKCYEIKHLGWQRTHNFYAFADGSYNGKFSEIDDNGIVDVANKKFYFPAFSSVYVNDDEERKYRNDRNYKYKSGDLDFNGWAALMDRVFCTNDNGKIAVCFFIASLFRDYLYENGKWFPHCFLVGETSSGKSQLGWAFNDVFCCGNNLFNLNSGTDVGFYRKLENTVNTVQVFEEYHNGLPEERFQALKNAFDGNGRIKGDGVKGMRTIESEINSALCIIGQFLPTRDTCALLNRSLLLEFPVKNDWTEDDRSALKQLETANRNGTSNVIGELIQYRDIVETGFVKEYTAVATKLRQWVGTINKTIVLNERILNNYAKILTPFVILVNEGKIKYPFAKSGEAEQGLNDLFKRTAEKVITQQLQFISSDALSTFWNILQQLFDESVVSINAVVGDFAEKADGAFKEKIHYDFKIKDGNEYLVLFIDQVYLLYKEKCERKRIDALDKASLRTYLKSKPYTFDISKKTRIGASVKYCCWLNYESLPIDFLRDSDKEAANAFDEN